MTGRRTSAAAALLAALLAACSSPGGGRGLTGPEALRATALTFAEIESCLDGARDELPPTIDPTGVDLGRLGSAAAVSRADVAACPLERAAAETAAIPGGSTKLDLARTTATRALHEARRVRSAMLELLDAIDGLIDVGLRSPDAPLLLREQSDAAGRVEEGLAGLEVQLEELNRLEFEIRNGAA